MTSLSLLVGTTVYFIGNTTTVVQDSFMYRMEHGIASLLLDDDNCDCQTTLNLGHGMCGAGYSTSYGPEKLGVDLLYDPGCQTPSPDNGLTLYFRGSLHF